MHHFQTPTEHITRRHRIIYKPMRPQQILLTISFLLTCLIAQGQTLDLSDCIKIHKSNSDGIIQILKSKDSKWLFYNGMWQFDDGLNATFIRKTEGDLTSSEIIIITNNKSITTTLMADIKRNSMVQDGSKSVFIGKNYAVGFIVETNDSGQDIFSIHVMPRSMYKQ